MRVMDAMRAPGIPAWTVLAIVLALATAGCAGGVAGAPSRSDGGSHALAMPLLMLSGARLATAADSSGTPALAFGAAPFTLFVHPVAVAARGEDVYIADSGTRRVYRFVRALNAMVAFTGVTVGPGTRIAVGSDFSLYVLDPAARRVQQFARNGQMLAIFGDDINVGRPVAMVADEARGLFLIADGLYNQIVAFHPLGRASYTIALRGDARNRVLGIAGLALGASELYVSDPLCRCIARVARDGGVLETFGHREIGQPGPIAVDRYQRVFVIDGFTSGIKVFAGGRLIHDLSPAALGLAQINDLWISGDLLYVADGVGARVAEMRLAPPRHGE